MTLMGEFPPRLEDQVTLANWRQAPFSRWAFHHVRELIPTAEIASDPLRVRPLEGAGGGLNGLAGVKVAGPDGATTLDRWLTETSTDGFVVLHRGRLAGEYYANGMTAYTPHILMSVSKSVLGLLAGILVGRGSLDPDRPVSAYVPEVRETAFGDATVRHLLDMRVGVAFEENYLATSGPIIAYRKAQGWNPVEPGEKPSDLRSFFGLLTERDGTHGGRFHYVSPCTDLLGWVIERATGRRYADVLSERLWRPMGAEAPAYITVDRLGAPRAAGGMCTTTRDLARLGQMVLESGAGVVPKLWIDDILTAGDAAAWDVGSFIDYYPGVPMHYRSKWYVERGEPMMFCLGVHGQNLFVDPARELVIAKFSSQAQPLDAGLIARTAAGVTAIRRALG